MNTELNSAEALIKAMKDKLSQEKVTIKSLKQNHNDSEPRGINIYFGCEKFIPITPRNDNEAEMIKTAVKDFCEYHDITLNDFHCDFV